MDTGRHAGSWEAGVSRNTAILGAWTGAWVATMAVATFGPRYLWDGNQALSLAAILVNLAIGVGVIVANRRHLMGLDELQQRIQLEAMALSLGVGLVAGLAYSNLEVSHLIPGHAEIANLVILMGLTYAAGIFAGLRKYR
ncbi:MAG: hypothetical protein AB7H88_16795 [Vicinamibacterales bacterium]